MPISPQDADQVLVKCARHCCICRRFKPLQLQVHHIVPSSEGGSDEVDNLIAVCLTCHCDVHTKAPFTRRFTANELKLHRQAIYELVSQGKLPHPEFEPTPFDPARVSRPASQMPSLGPAAVEVLVLAAESDGTITYEDRIGLMVSTKVFGDGESAHRERAHYRAALDQLMQVGAARFWSGATYKLTDQGYLLADEFLALGARPDSGRH